MSIRVGVKAVPAIIASPTAQVYSELITGYDELNRRLFDGRLPGCVFTVGTTRNGVLGHFCGEHYSEIDGHGSADEVMLNARYFRQRKPLGVLSTLAHEMVHQLQSHEGKTGRGGYHNKQWGRWMKEIGLYPSHTGEPGGSETGRQMTHYVVAGGRFDRLAGGMIADGFRFSWQSAGAADGRAVTRALARPGESGGSRTKFTCPCGDSAWGKHTLRLVCGKCHAPMVPWTPKWTGRREDKTTILRFELPVQGEAVLSS